MTDAATFAKSIAGRHRRRERFTLEMPQGCVGDMDFAYATQEALIPRLGAGGLAIVGWKIGLTTPRMQAMCGIDEPIVGAVLAGRTQASPGRAAVADHARLGMESEMAVRIGRAPPADVSPERVLDYVDGVCAAFELIDDSAADYGRLSAATLVADNAWNAGLVTGPLRAAAGFGALSGRRGVLFKGGEPVDEGTSSDVLGDPANALAWLAQHLAARGRALEAGQWVSTGSIATTKFVAPGETWRFELDGLEPVELVVT